ncbi:hypothetical protein [Streptosporangium lutulentum]|uniref:Uncharacterized protein n=1 Tax=Streptosporangium lutulentum TaxID=1461250 RepID=A0ABT9QH01_9ACTN|nr:hypothetical protein [Streptosporangium lutulentum]MDP9846040.1 hypothetical protein [Streptosporangium lutulentum]
MTAVATTLRPLLLTATGSIAVLGAVLAIRATPADFTGMIPASTTCAGVTCGAPASPAPLPAASPAVTSPPPPAPSPAPGPALAPLPAPTPVSTPPADPGPATRTGASKPMTEV